MGACDRTLLTYVTIFSCSMGYLLWYNADRWPRWLHHIISTFAVAAAVLSTFYAIPTLKHIC